jgi:hypothetical protein
MEKRMDSIEGEAAKVDKLEKSATSLLMIVEKLLTKVGLNPSVS